MKYVRTILGTLLLAVCLLFAAAEPAQAKDPFGEIDCGKAANSAICKDGGNKGNPLVGQNGILARATRLIAAVSGAVAVIIILYGGYVYVSSAGDPSRINKAKDTIIWASVGLVVILFGQWIIIFILNRL